MPLIPPLVDLSGLGASLEQVNKDFQSQLTQIIRFSESFIDDSVYQVQEMIIKIISLFELGTVCVTTAFMIYIVLFPESFGGMMDRVGSLVKGTVDSASKFIPKLSVL
jgi:hypothetical protein